MIKRYSTQIMITPLLDLLIIVIFAQLLEAKQQVETHISLAQEAEIAGQRAEEERRAATETRESVDLIITQQLEQINELKQQVQRLESEREALTVSTETLQTQLRDLGRMFQSQFKMPEDILDEMLADVTASEADRIKNLLDDIQDATPLQAIRTMRQLHEVLRRVDFWGLYIDDSGRLFFDVAGELQNDFRIGGEEQLRRDLQRAMENQSDPSRMVFILLSYHSSTDIMMHRRVTGVLQALLKILETRFQSTQFFENDWGIIDERP